MSKGAQPEGPPPEAPRAPTGRNEESKQFETDRQTEEWFCVYYTTRILRNAATPGPLTPRHKCTVCGDDDDTPL
jgi:hypothetical protein